MKILVSILAPTLLTTNINLPYHSLDVKKTNVSNTRIKFRNDLYRFERAFLSGKVTATKNVIKLAKRSVCTSDEDPGIRKNY